MSNRLVTYLDRTDLGLSRRLWKRVPIDTWRSDSSEGLLFEDNHFAGFAVPVAAAAVNYGGGPWGMYADIGASLTNEIDEIHTGAILCGNLSNEEAWATGNQGFVVDNNTAGNSRELWFEARVKWLSIADNDAGTFIGLQENTAAADLFTDAGALHATSGWLGFARFEADGNAVDFVYKEASETMVTVLADAHIPVADTYVNLGFHYNPMNSGATQIEIWVNGVIQTTFVTLANINTDTFPEAQMMRPTFGGKCGSGAAGTITCSAVRCAQEMRTA